MENERIAEINLQIAQLKKTSPEVYSWITLKEKKKELEEMLNSDDPHKNCEENRKELTETEEEMSYLKKRYSSLVLYDCLVSVKQKIIEKSKEYDVK